jgi:hypothetical protein
VTAPRVKSFTLDDAARTGGARIADAASGLPRRLIGAGRHWLWRGDGVATDLYGGADVGGWGGGIPVYSSPGRFLTSAFQCSPWSFFPAAPVEVAPEQSLTFALWEKGVTTQGYSNNYLADGTSQMRPHGFYAAIANDSQVIVAVNRWSTMILGLLFDCGAGLNDVSQWMHFYVELKAVPTATGMTIRADGVRVWRDNVECALATVIADPGWDIDPATSIVTYGGIAGSAGSAAVLSDLFLGEGIYNPFLREALFAGGPPTADQMVSRARFTAPEITAAKRPTGILLPGATDQMGAFNAGRNTRAYLSRDAGATRLEAEVGRYYPTTGSPPSGGGAPCGGAGAAVTLDVEIGGGAWVADAMGGGPTLVYEEADPPTVYVPQPRAAIVRHAAVVSATPRPVRVIHAHRPTTVNP